MPVGNVDPLLTGETTLAYSRSDLGVGRVTVTTDGNGATGAIPHGLNSQPVYADMTPVFPSGGFGGSNVPGSWALSIQDDTNIGFRIFLPDGSMYTGRQITLVWVAVAV